MAVGYKCEMGKVTIVLRTSEARYSYVMSIEQIRRMILEIQNNRAKYRRYNNWMRSMTTYQGALTAYQRFLKKQEGLAARELERAG